MASKVHKDSARVSVHDVARLAGVSKTTAAYVLGNKGHFQPSEETRRKILEAASTLGYRRSAIAAALSSGRMNTFGVSLYNPLQKLEDSRLMFYYKEVLTYLAVAAARAGLHIVPFLLDEGSTLSEEEVTDQRIDGLIITSPIGFETYALLDRVKLPFVEYSTGKGQFIIAADNHGGATQATEHLIGLGHRRIIHFTSCLDTGSMAFPLRRDGFLDTMKKHGLLTDAQNAVIVQPAEIKEILRLPPAQRPTAIFTSLEQEAFDVLDFAREAGLSVPRELSLVAFDNGPVSVLARPKLTTIHAPYDAMAEAAIALLAQLCEREGIPEVPPPFITHLVVRQSTAPPCP